MARRSVSAVGSIGLVLLSSIARADDRAPLRVHVSADGGCVTETAFWSALARRTDRLRPAEPLEPAATMDIAIRRDGATYRGDMRLMRDGEKRPAAKRRATGATCGEIVDGLSLVAARSVDDLARVDPDQQPVESAADEGLPPPPAAPNAPERPDGETARADDAAPPPTLDAPGDDRMPSNEWRVGFGAAGALVTYASSGISVGGYADVALDRRGWAPAFRLAFAHGEQPFDEAHASLAFTYATLTASPWRGDLSRTLTFRPSVGVDAGSLSGQASTMVHVGGELAWSLSSLFYVESDVRMGARVLEETYTSSGVDYKLPRFTPSWTFAAGARLP